MRTSRWVLLLVVVLADAGCHRVRPAPVPAPSGPSQQELLRELQGYADRDLTALDETERATFRTLMLRLARNNNGVLDDRVHPRYVWSFEANDRPTFWLVLGTWGGRPNVTPGGDVQFVMFDESGTWQSRTGISTGPDSGVLSARRMPDPTGGYAMIVADLAPGEAGYARLVYANVDGRWSLVRIEDKKGRAVRNGRHRQNWDCDPIAASPFAQADDAWEADLRSPERARVLRTLVLLGSRRPAARPNLIPENSTAWDREAADEFDLVGRLRVRPGVVARLAELAKDQDAWIREAAELARRPGGAQE